MTFDPCAVYAPWETDFTILHMENDYDQAYYEAYHKLLPRLPGYDLRLKAQVTFASTLIYNIGGFEHTREEALESARGLLHAIHQTSADHT